MFRTPALKHFLSLAGCKTSKLGRGSFPQTNTGVCVQNGPTPRCALMTLWLERGRSVQRANCPCCLPSATEKQHFHPKPTAPPALQPSASADRGLVGSHRSVPEGDVPSLEQDFSVLLPHLQQHVKQLRHWEAITLQGEENQCNQLMSRCS